MNNFISSLEESVRQSLKSIYAKEKHILSKAQKATEVLESSINTLKSFIAVPLKSQNDL